MSDPRLVPVSTGEDEVTPVSWPEYTKEEFGVPLKRLPRGWPDGRPSIVECEFTKVHVGEESSSTLTTVLVLDEDGGVWIGSSKRHEDDPDVDRVGNLLALQRAIRVGSLRDFLRSLNHEQLMRVLKGL